MKQVWPSAIAVIAAILLCGITVQVSHAATPEQVDKAIKKAIDYIYSQQQNGNWEVVEKREPTAAAHLVKGWQWGGPTSIAVCALLYAKENDENPKLKEAIDWMLKAEVYV